MGRSTWQAPCYPRRSLACGISGIYRHKATVFARWNSHRPNLASLGYAGQILSKFAGKLPESLLIALFRKHSAAARVPKFPQQHLCLQISHPLLPLVEAC